MKDVLVSVIMPIYNCEEYLKKSINSVLNSKLENLELLLINNNSKDKSKDIALKFKKKDSRVKYFEEKKQGASYARNKGLKEAKGKYVAFVDADDYIGKTMLFNAYEFADENKLDMVHLGSVCHTDKERFVHVIPYKNKEILKREKIENDYIPLLFSSKSEKEYDRKLVRAMWGKLIKRDLINKNNISFSNHINGQDFLFTLELACKAKNIGILKKGYYNYRSCVEGSLSKRYDIGRYYRILKLEEDLKQVLVSNNLYTKEIERRFEIFVRHDIFWVLRMIASENNSGSLMEKISDMRKVLSSKTCEKAFEDPKEDLFFQQRALYFLIKNKLSLLIYALIRIKKLA